MDKAKFHELDSALNRTGFQDKVSLYPAPGEGEDVPCGYVAFNRDQDINRINTLRVMNTLGYSGMRVVGIDGPTVYFEDPAFFAKQHHTPPGQVG